MPSTSMPKYTLPRRLVSLSSDNCVPPKKEYGESCTCFYFDILWLMFKFTKEKYIMTFETKLQNPPSCMPQCINFVSSRTQTFIPHENVEHFLKSLPLAIFFSGFQSVWVFFLHYLGCHGRESAKLILLGLLQCNINSKIFGKQASF